VTFAQDVSQCAGTASAGPTGGGQSWLNAWPWVHTGSADPHQVEVWFNHPDGSGNTVGADTDFHLIVAC
jgi:hypothetical protein